MPTMDPQVPATKQDITLLKQDVTQLLYLELGKVYEDLSLKILSSEERIIRHFDFTVEQIKVEAFGSQKDKLSLHDDRLDGHERRILALERK